MRSTAVQKRSQGVVRSSSLSVVVVSTGSPAVTRHATEALSTATSDLSVQCIVVSRNHDPGLATAVARSGAEFVAAPRGCTRAEMCDLGMGRVSGTIVAVRDDVSVGDASWLEAYRRILPKREALARAATESVVMDTMTPVKVALADSPAARGSLESRGDRSSIEVAAAV